jgi:hypothetical protein
MYLIPSWYSGNLCRDGRQPKWYIMVLSSLLPCLQWYNPRSLDGQLVVQKGWQPNGIWWFCPGYCSAAGGSAQTARRAVRGAERVDHQPGVQRPGQPCPHHHLDQNGTLINQSNISVFCSWSWCIFFRFTEAKKCLAVGDEQIMFWPYAIKCMCRQDSTKCNELVSYGPSLFNKSRSTVYPK